MILQLTNDTKNYSFEVNDLNYGEKLYYNFQIPTAEMEDGKYNMVLIDDNDVVVAEDVVCIGDFNAETIQYKRAENVYINTTLDANIEDVKEESIDNFETTIYPTDGYDAMKAVVVNAQPVYDNGYNEGENIGYNSGYTAGDADGYNRGYNEGETAQKAKLTGITITENGTYTREDGYNEVVVEVPDLNGSYDEGYDAGKVDGYDSGYTAGETEQKSKLTNITITENGTYTREDGYNSVVVDVPDLNGSYDEGYQAGIEEGTANAGEIIAQTARVLNITENGHYLSQYSDPVIKTGAITGKYPNGDNFYDYAYISKRGYNTGIFPGPTTKLEFWWRFDGNIEGNEGLIVGAQKWGEVGSIFKVAFGPSSDGMVASINDKTINFTLQDAKWHHLAISFADGLVVDGDKIGDFEENLAETSTYEPICINGYYGNSRINADYFGMVIIDDTIFIPTANGWLNTNTNEYLPIVKNYNGNYIYTQVKPEYIEPTGNLIKTVNVDVQPKINVAETGFKLGYSTFKTIPDCLNFEGITDMSYMFYNCGNLTTLPLIETSTVANMECSFEGCGSLQTIPAFNTSNVTNMANLFYRSPNLISISPLNANKLILGNYNGLFYFTTMNNLTDFGGLIGFKGKSNNDYTFVRCPNLTYQSCINILNGLYDFTGNGETPTSEQGQLKVHQNFLDLVGDEISIGTNKGWTITA